MAVGGTPFSSTFAPSWRLILLCSLAAIAVVSMIISARIEPDWDANAREKVIWLKARNDQLEKELRSAKIKLESIMVQRPNKTIDLDSKAHATKNAESPKFLLHDEPHPDMSCDDNRTCCVPWDVDIDEWWMHHPDWRIVTEDIRSTCFSKHPEPKATFFRELYQMQWLYDGAKEYNQKKGHDIYQRDELPTAGRKCSHLYRRFQLTSGYGSNLGTTMQGLSIAHELKRPFALSKLIPDSVWMYTAKTNETANWSWCPTGDLNCFILPIGNCLPPDGTALGGYRFEDPRPWNPNETTEEYRWLTEYLLRYRHELRRRARRQIEELILKYPQYFSNGRIAKDCVTFQVRRSDAGLHHPPWRRYVGLTEYVDAAQVRHDEPIVLITDDSSTIEEVTRFYPDYAWIYSNAERRNMSFGEFGGHISSEVDPGDDFVTMVAEAMIGSQCQRLVHTNSGFVRVLRSAYHLAGRDRPEEIEIDARVSEEEAAVGKGTHDRSEMMIESIFREAARAYENRTGESVSAAKEKTRPRM